MSCCGQKHWEQAPFYQAMCGQPKMKNFCSECGAKLGKNGKPVVEFEAGDPVCWNEESQAYQIASAGSVRKPTVVDVKTWTDGLPDWILCTGEYVNGIAKELLKEEPKPEPVGNFRHGDEVFYMKEKRCSVIAKILNSLSSVNGKCYDFTTGTRSHHSSGPWFFRHVHKCDDGRTCNCPTCNPCGKADDLDCTCEKCCPRTLDGLVDLFGADVVRARCVEMAEMSKGHDAKWLQRLAYAGVGIMFQDSKKHPISGCNPPSADVPRWAPDSGRYHRIYHGFYFGGAWAKLNTFTCSFDGKNWTPTKGSE
jgi:hypothetical protein